MFPDKERDYFSYTIAKITLDFSTYTPYNILSVVGESKLIEIVAPTHCPSCGSLLNWENDQLFCYSSICSSKTNKAIQHFASTLKIKGFGPSTVEKLKIVSVVEIYDLFLADLVEALNSEKLATKIYQEIQDSTSCSLVDLLPAFSIPLIGRSASAKLCGVITSIYEINEESCLAAGLGPKATANLLKWHSEEFLSELFKLPFSFEVADTLVRSTEVQGTVCISGKLTSFKTKAEAQKALLECGYIVKSSLTKDVTILINESGIESSKTQKARDNGVSIITNITQLIG